MKGVIGMNLRNEKPAKAGAPGWAIFVAGTAVGALAVNLAQRARDKCEGYAMSGAS